MSGPFDTEDQARAAAHQVISPDPGRSILTFEQNRELLRQALGAAGVTSGAYDDRILDWLGNWEDSVVSVIAGWISRANVARARDAMEQPAAHPGPGIPGGRPVPLMRPVIAELFGLGPATSEATAPDARENGGQP